MGLKTRKAERWFFSQKKGVKSTDLPEVITKSKSIKAGLSLTRGPYVEAEYKTETTQQKRQQIKNKLLKFRVK